MQKQWKIFILFLKMCLNVFDIDFDVEKESKPGMQGIYLVKEDEFKLGEVPCSAHAGSVNLLLQGFLCWTIGF